MNYQSHSYSEWSQSRISAFLTNQKQIQQTFLNDPKYFCSAKAMIFPTLRENSRFLYIPDFTTWKKDYNYFPTFSRFFNTVGALFLTKINNCSIRDKSFPGEYQRSDRQNIYKTAFDQF